MSKKKKESMADILKRMKPQVDKELKQALKGGMSFHLRELKKLREKDRKRGG